jgi:sortase A
MRRTLVNTVLELVLTAGAVALLFVVYQAYVTDIFSDREQEEVAEDLRTGWSLPPPAPGPVQPAFGEAFAFLHFPELDEPARAVLEGTDAETLLAGPAHYPGTAMPGEIGNFSVAGHRVGTGAPFRDIDHLEPGDPVVVETRDTWFTYRVTESRIVQPADGSVIQPIPGGSEGYFPTQAYLTLTTCHPEFSNRERLVVHALLSEAVAKADQPRGPDLLSAG